MTIPKFQSNDLAKRALYETLQKMYPGADISESYLRQQQIITDGKASYKYNFVADQKDLPEKYLIKQDIFVAFEVGVFLLAENANTPGKGVLQTYPNIIVFPDVSEGFQNADLEAIYNGHLKTKVGTQDVSQPIDLIRFRNVPTTQQNAATNGAKVSENTGFGFVKLDAYQIFNGALSNEAEIEIPTWPGQKIANGLLHKIVLMHRGFIIKSVNKA